MQIGVPKEIKVHKYRVGLTPDGVSEFVAHGHRVLVETRAGEGIACSDDEYILAGAEITDAAEPRDRTQPDIDKDAEQQKADGGPLKNQNQTGDKGVKHGSSLK